MNRAILKLPYISRYGIEREFTFPACFEVCPRCDGCGSHVNPAIDGNGLSREDFDQDPDFEEDYFAGVYDVPCEECRGLRVVPVFDEAHASKRQRARYAVVQRQRDEIAAEARADARTAWYEMGCRA